MNEIFKGMDNAAEQINENFGNLEPERGQNENGHYIRYPDGTQRCWGTAVFNRDIGELTIETPSEFITQPTAQISANNHSFANLQDTALLGVGTNVVGDLRVMKHTSLPVWRGTGDMVLIWETFGIWK